MNGLRKIYKFAESYRFSGYIMGTGVVFYLFLAIWSLRIPNSWLVNIAGLWTFKIFYILLFVNLALCSARRISEIKVAGDIRNRLRIVGSILFHLSLFLLPPGFFLSRTGNFSGTAVLAEGQYFQGRPEEYVMTEPENAAPSLFPQVSFQLQKVEAEFWTGGFLFKKLISYCAVNYGSETSMKTSELNRPFRMNGAIISLAGYSWSPVYRFEKEGAIFSEGAVNLKVFPSGKDDFFQIPDTHYYVFLRVWGDYADKNGEPTSVSFGLKNVRVDVRVVRGKTLVYSGLLKPGEKAYFEGVALSFPEVRNQAQFRIISNSGFAFIWAGFITAMLGLALRYVQ